MEELRRVVNSLQRAAAEAGVQVVTGDTKVVEKGKGDGLFINTTGIGLVPEGVELSADRARPGDKVLLSGSIGDHGIAILAQREGLEFETQIQSDSAALHTLVAEMLGVTSNASRDSLHARPDARRRLQHAERNRASNRGSGSKWKKVALPIHEEVRGACELLGLDPLYVANEGKLIAIVAPEAAGAVLQAMRRHPLGAEAQIIGTVKKENPGLVTMRTPLGTTRVVDMLVGRSVAAHLLRKYARDGNREFGAGSGENRDGPLSRKLSMPSRRTNWRNGGHRSGSIALLF